MKPLQYFKNVLLNLLFVSLLFTSCGEKKDETVDRVVIGIASDIQTLNPLFAISVDEGTIVELLFLSLFDFRWDDEKGELKSQPMLADSWEWADDSSSLKIYLRDDVFWSDGKKLTSKDVIFSFEVYSDPEVNSRLYGSFRNLFTDENNKIKIEKTFKDVEEYEFTILFPKNSLPNIDEISFPIVPEHIFGGMDRSQIEKSENNFNPVSCGAFQLKKWDRNQLVSLSVNRNSFLINDESIDELVFKIVPDYVSRVLQLKKGDIDLVELVKTEDIREIENTDDLNIVSVVGREYDYIGWNNIDPQIYSTENDIVSHKLFGNSKVRIALSHAINREEILEEYLLNYGKLAESPISDLFKGIYNDEIAGYEYNVQKSKQMLGEEGWKDTDQNGILDKNGMEFSFTMYYPSGNPLREYAATIIVNNLAAVGIKLNAVNIELGNFIDKLNEKSMDAWMAAWYIPIPIELKAFWYSDIEMTALNFASYQNEDADIIMDDLEEKINSDERKKLYYRFQEIIHKDQPFTFLYWIPNITVYNNKIKNINITPLGSVTHCWEWQIN